MKAPGSRPVLLACSALALLWTAVPALAQDSATEGEEIVLDRVEIEGRQAAAPASDTPLATQTSSEDIARREIDSISDLGNTTEPGIDYSKRTDTVVIRGLSGPRIATVIDGIPIPYIENFARGGGPTGSITNADGGGSSFDFSSLSALDVLRGADSSKIGSGALGGALVMRTLEPDDLIEEGRTWGGLTKLTYDSEDNSVTGSLALAARGGATSVLFQGSYKKGDETKTNGDDASFGRSRTEADPADLDQNNLLFKLRHDIEGGHQIGITAERFERQLDVGLASSWTVVQGFSPATQYTYPVGRYNGHDDTLRERISLDYQFESPDPTSMVESAFAKAYWQQLTKNAGAEGTQVRVIGGLEIPYLRDNELQERAFGFVGGATGNYTTGTLEHEWRMGVDFSSFATEHFITAVPTTAEQADIPLVEGTRLGIFVENRIGFGESGFALTPGIRLDWHSYTPKATPEYTNLNPGNGVFGLPPEHSDARVSPKLLATYDLNPEVQFFAQWAAAYRAPTVNELYLNFTNPTTGYAQIGNVDLKPETGHGFEVGADLGTQDFGGRITVFHNRYRNFIDTTPLTPDPNYPSLPFGIGRYINIDEVHISGVEARAHKVFENGFRIHGGLAYAYGRDVTAGTSLRSVAPLKAIAGIGYDRETWGVDLTGIYAAGMRDDGDPNTFDAPSYAVANLTAWWEPEQVKGLRLQAGVYNLFDETYYDALGVRSVNLNAAASQPMEFYSEPGRSFKFSLTQRF